MATRSVLLVDDTPDVRALVRRALERSGGLEVVAEVGDGAAAVVAARHHQPDVVLLDIAMPVMDGLEALPKIQEAAPRATVIMLSAFTADKMTETAVTQGAVGYIQKGRPMSELVSRVHELIAPGSEGPTDRDGPTGPFRMLRDLPVMPSAQVWCT
jgi:DNA-binding NarL/FixJ family response regulator